MRLVIRAKLFISSLLFLVLVIGGALAPRASPNLALLYAAILLLAFWIPAQVLSSAADVWRHWRRLLVWTLLSTVIWDLTTSVGFGHRGFLSEWPLVYTSGPVVLFLLLLVHGWLTHCLLRYRSVRSEDDPATGRA